MATQLTIPPANDADRRDPAPGELELVRQLVNTYDWEDHSDDLATPEALRDWLAARGLMGADEPVGQADVHLTAEVREGLRSLFLTNHGEAPDPETIAALNGAARIGPLRVHFDASGAPSLVAAGDGVPGALATMLGIVLRAKADGTFDRLKVCPADDCLWAFYDHSRNRSKQWCRMEVCGNRAKARSYRERRRSA